MPNGAPEIPEDHRRRPPHLVLRLGGDGGRPRQRAVPGRPHARLLRGELRPTLGGHRPRAWDGRDGPRRSLGRSGSPRRRRRRPRTRSGPARRVRPALGVVHRHPPRRGGDGANRSWPRRRRARGGRHFRGGGHASRDGGVGSRRGRGGKPEGPCPAAGALLPLRERQGVEADRVGRRAALLFRPPSRAQGSGRGHERVHPRHLPRGGPARGARRGRRDGRSRRPRGERRDPRGHDPSGRGRPGPAPRGSTPTTAMR